MVEVPDALAHGDDIKTSRGEIDRLGRRNQEQNIHFVPCGEPSSFRNLIFFDIRSDPSEKLTGKETLKQILKIAIGLEKDSIVFYYGMQEMVPEHLGKDKIGVIIQEEMRHIADLSETLKAIDAKA